VPRKPVDAQPAGETDAKGDQGYDDKPHDEFEAEFGLSEHESFPLSKRWFETE
jgi:hypothetical protein